MYNQIDEVRKLWQGEAIDRLNGKGKTIQVQTYPRPVQKELPIWVTTGGSRETYIKAGRAGANLLTHLLGQDLDTLAENIEAYRTARAEAGFNAESGTVSLMLHTYMDNDLEAVRRTVYEPFKEYLRSNIGLWKKLADNSGLDEARLTSDSDIEQLLEISFEKYWNTLSLMGTPETCTRMVEKLMDMGVDEIACLIDFGIEEQAVMDSLEKITQWKKTFESQENQIASAGDSEPVTIMQTTPSLLKIMVNDTGSHQFIESLQTLLVGGEAISASLISQVRELSSTRIFNMYGPTETTIWSSVHEIQQDETKIGLGKPIGNTQIHIVDDHLNKVPFGVLGEICIGGEGV
uniref:AMP-dependent synthetase/ligase domain-containing protein n=1 Tax=Caenorhabditis japonica TaxID=281687 RepID=A0A8R1IR77_CAEJA